MQTKENHKEKQNLEIKQETLEMSIQKLNTRYSSQTLHVTQQWTIENQSIIDWRLKWTEWNKPETQNWDTRNDKFIHKWQNLETQNHTEKKHNTNPEARQHIWYSLYVNSNILLFLFLILMIMDDTC